MGGRESKPYSLTYEDAVKRVSEAELSRLKSAYKRTATNGGAINYTAFSREVLGETVPVQLSKQIFAACGGSSKGISFKDLLCSLVLLTKGSPEEKIRFIFSIYSNESGNCILRSDLQHHLQATEGADKSRSIVRSVMKHNEKLSYEDFRNWLLENQDATSITRWLLCAAGSASNSLASPVDTPTFYQTLAGVTHLEENEILELEKSYWVLKGSSPSGRLDPSTLTPLLAPPLTPSLARGLFNAFDENRDQHIDFKEMACGISAACRGPLTERQKFLFKIFDRDRDGLLNKEELSAMVTALLALNMEEKEEAWDTDGVCVGVEPEPVERMVEDILNTRDSGGLGGMTQEDYLMWTLENTLTHTFLTIIFQVCHIVLGLRPPSPREEGAIVTGWLQRELSRQQTVGHFWYIVNMEWWNCWLQYVTQQGDYSNSVLCHSNTNSLKRTKFQKKAQANDGHVALDNSGGITIRSISSLSTMSLDDTLSVGMIDGEASTCWTAGVQSRVSSSKSKGNGSSSDPVYHISDNHLNTQGNHQQIPSLTITSDSHMGNGNLLNGFTANGSIMGKKAASAANLYLVSDTSARSSAQSTPSPSPMVSRKGSARGAFQPRPPAIDNSALVESVPSSQRALQLTWEGGRLKKSVPLVQGRDFILLPETLWKTLYQCYGGAPALPRQVIHGRAPGEVELELYPINVRIYRHSQPPPPLKSVLTYPSGLNNVTSLPSGGVGGAATHWMGVMGGYGAAAISRIADSAPHYVSGITNNFSGSNKRYLAHLAAFSKLASLSQVYQYLSDKLRISKDDMRLYLISQIEGLILLEDCAENTLEGSEVTDASDILLEVRNKDLTWPEEMNQITTTSSNSQSFRQNSIKVGTVEKGVTGLHNLGNTCFLNSAIQCCSNTAILTNYFQRNLHLYELNPNNPNGMRGHVAREYGNLLHELWGGEARSVAPLKLRWTIGKWSGNFTGVDQHDSQELLAFLLDGLHEDLNRVQHKPYTELKDSEGRPDTLVAQEAWENHIVRNKSIIVDLFHGQLKSKVSCKECGHQSARFDPFTYLSLQLPMESYSHLEVIVVTLDGLVPKKYGLRLIEDSKYRDIKKKLHEMTGVLPQHLMLADLTYLPPQIKYIPVDDCRIRLAAGTVLYAYELPAPLLPANKPKVAISNETKNATYKQNGHAGSYKNMAEYIRKSRETLNNGDDVQELEMTKIRQQQVNESVNDNTTSCHSTKDRQTLSKIQRATATSNNSLLSVTDEVDGRDNKCSISPAPSPEPPLLLSGESQSLGNERNVLTRKDSSGSLNSTASAPCASTVTPTAASYNSTFLPIVNTESDLSKTNKGFIIAYHRKLIRQEVYFLSSQKCKPSLFGLPLVVACSEGSTHKSIYERVWRQVSRLVTPLPPSETPASSNHAADCDDSLGYEFPFVLRMVEREGLQCAVCSWYHFCRGCQLKCDDTPFPSRTVAFLAIDWDPTALHLRYQSTLERHVLEDSSVAEERHRHTEPISLQNCLDAFTSEETLEYSCQKCKKIQPAHKKLQIWRLPPLLIVHLKRFQFVGQKWIKSQKIVQFPLREFDPTDYLASVPKETLLLHSAQLEGKLGYTQDEVSQHSSLPHISEDTMMNGYVNGVLTGPNSLPPLAVDEESDLEEDAFATTEATKPVVSTKRPTSFKKRVRNGSVLYGDALQDFHQHRLADDQDSLKLSYDLYAIVCHSGVMEAGHYVCYAKNPQKKWVCFNDSSCKEVSEKEIDLDSAYLLFYERKGLDASKYMPNVSGLNPQPLTQLDSEVEAEYKKQCSLM